jgi:hypothetical protein
MGRIDQKEIKMLKNLSVFSNAGGNPPNGPSTTGKPSGGGRGNNSPK